MPTKFPTITEAMRRLPAARKWAPGYTPAIVNAEDRSGFYIVCRKFPEHVTSNDNILARVF